MSINVFLSFHIGRDKSLRGNHVTVAHQKVHWLHLLVAPEGALCPSQAGARSCIDHVTVAQWFTGVALVHQKVHCLHQAGALVHKPEGLMQWQRQCGLQPAWIIGVAAGSSSGNQPGSSLSGWPTFCPTIGVAAGSSSAPGCSGDHP